MFSENRGVGELRWAFTSEGFQLSIKGIVPAPSKEVILQHALVAILQIADVEKLDGEIVKSAVNVRRDLE
jgi:hypothetical protein